MSSQKSNQSSSLTSADLKVQILSDLVNRCGHVSDLLYGNRNIDALDSLWYRVFPLLPPDVREDKTIIDDEKKIVALWTEREQLTGINSIDMRRRKDYFIHKQRQTMRQILQDITMVLYNKYFRAGYRGADVARLWGEEDADKMVEE